ncbi:MAG TPA: hypothetical protein VK871_13465 [Candidatus Limnocylindrales bacterium]|nr:hypothetical protein [Candidatus Limnocylindrales bacterium]
MAAELPPDLASLPSWGWNGYIDDLRKLLGDPEFRLTDDTLIACQRFRVVATIDPESGRIAWLDAVPSEPA